MDNKTNNEQELHEHYRFHVDPNQTPVRIDKFLFDRMEKVSRNRIQNATKDGSILVNDKPVKSNYKVRPRDVIVIVLPEEPREKHIALAEDIPLDIRYEDDDIIILHKPVGLVVHPGTGNYSGTLVNGLLHYLKDHDDIPVLQGNEGSRAGLVHRIDKNTTGLMVIAKNQEAMSFLAKQFFDHTIEREYHAIVWGEPNVPNGLIDAHIGRHMKDRTKMDIFPDGDFGKHAITHFEIIEPLYYVSLLKCHLETGRTHQIRAHLAHIGHPLFSDEKYGGDSIKKGTVFTNYKQFVNNVFKVIPRHALHAKSLGFIHPRTREKVFFDSELPEDMLIALDKWRNYLKHRKQKL